MSIDYKKEVVQLRKEELEVIAEAFILSNGKILLGRPDEENNVLCYKPAGAAKSTCKFNY